MVRVAARFTQAPVRPACLARLDVLVQPEQVVGVVAVLQRHQPLVLRLAVPVADAVRSGVKFRYAPRWRTGASRRQNARLAAISRSSSAGVFHTVDRVEQVAGFTVREGRGVLGHGRDALADAEDDHLAERHRRRGERGRVPDERVDGAVGEARAGTRRASSSADPSGPRHRSSPGTRCRASAGSGRPRARGP